MLYGEASSIARQATRELIMDAIKERLFDRLGKELTELGHIAADELADDIEANLEIEALIEARRKSRAETKSLVARVFRDAPKGKKKKKGQ